MKSAAAVTFLTLLLFIHPAFAKEYCIYTNEQGVKRKVRSIRQVPPELRRFAHCLMEGPAITSGVVKMASPKEIDLEGGLSKQRINSSVGPINLRWSRSGERVLGRSPMRAMADAGRMVSKALKRDGFPSKFSRLNLEWEVVFMDENVPIDQVPMQLVTNFHPAWMTPPANIYVVVQRVAAGSSGNVEAKMAEVLAHEMGHVLEAHILGTAAFGGERWRAEGFATFFERLASEYSTVIPAGSVKREHQRLARESFRASPDRFSFTGSAQDYARASMYIQAVVNYRGVRGLMRVYDRLKAGERSIMAAIKAETGWSDKKIESKARAAAGL